MGLYSELGVSQAELPIVLGRPVTNYGAGGGSPPQSVFNVSASDTIEYSEEVGGKTFFPSANDTIEFGIVSTSSLQTPTASDTIEFGIDSRNFEITEPTIIDTIVFSEIAISSLQTPLATDTIEFDDDAQEGLVLGGAIDASSSDTIEFSEIALATKIIAAGLDLTAGDTIEFTDFANIPIERSLSDTIELSTAISIEYVKFIEDTINFTEEVVLNRTLSLTITDTLVFADAVAFETNDPSLCTYSPFIGSATNIPGQPPPFSGTPPVITPASKVTLFYPTVSPTDSVEIRAPEFGNRDRLLFTRINRETRGGTLKIFADPSWPKVQRLVVTFTALKESEAQTVQTFFQTHLGQEVGFTDWESRTWFGYIVTPDEQLVRSRRGVVDISFEFEGELQ